MRRAATQRSDSGESTRVLVPATVAQIAADDRSCGLDRARPVRGGVPDLSSAWLASSVRCSRARPRKPFRGCERADANAHS